MVRVAAVEPSSLASELGIEPGTELLAVNGRRLRDYLDFEFLAAEPALLLRVRTPAGEETELEVERPEGVPLGMTLDPPGIMRCNNRCDFCFVNGNPKGARKPFFVRDDDYRLSFSHGNFATLTNLRRADVERIAEYRLSPLYVSVHATDPEVRRRLLRNRRAPAVLPQLAAFAAAGIRFHAQIVIVPGVNDGEVLERSLSDLYSLGATIQSLGVVPVALTRYSALDRVPAPTSAEAGAVLDAVDRWAARARRERGEGWVYGSDEMYQRAGRAFPSADSYDSFPQVENGVGAFRSLEASVMRERGGLGDLRGLRVLVCTGAAMAALMGPLVECLAATTGAAFDTVALENDYFGSAVTTAGLLPGRAFARALEGRDRFDLALLPAEAVNESRLFVDDVSLEDVERVARMPVRLSHDLCDALAATAAA